MDTNPKTTGGGGQELPGEASDQPGTEFAPVPFISTWPVHTRTGDPISLLDGAVYEVRVGGYPGSAIPVTCHRLADGRWLLYRTLVHEEAVLIGWFATTGWRIAEVLRIAGRGILTDQVVSAFDWEDLRIVDPESDRHKAIVRHARRPMLSDLGIEIGGAG